MRNSSIRLLANTAIQATTSTASSSSSIHIIPRPPHRRPPFASNRRHISSMTSALLNAMVTSPQTASAQPSNAPEKKHHNRNGKGFVNPWASYREWTAPEIVSKMLWMRLTGRWTNPDTSKVSIPIHRPQFLPTRQTSKLRTTWLGHACYYVEFPSGLRVLFDPVLEERCSPFTFMGPKRYTPAPCQIEDIPFIDVVCISHSHYDHLSYPGVKKIAARFPNVQFFVPLGNKRWFEGIGIRNVVELDWWEERELTLSASDKKKGSATVKAESEEEPDEDIHATFGCLPCQHQSGRTPFNRAHTLWASWSVTSGGAKLWFAGDTGYRSVPESSTGDFDYGEKYASLPHCPIFEEIGRLRGPFDLGLIPIGAYDPRWMMSPMHANPYDSVNIFVDSQCRRALGMHWGTWVLTTEEVMDPPRVLKEALKWKGLESEGVFDVCDLGESREYESAAAISRNGQDSMS